MNINHRICHCLLLRPEPPANGSDSTSQGFLSSFALPIKSWSPHLSLSSPDSLNPPEALLPVAAHLVQPPACSHSISLIRKRVWPFVHNHPHGTGTNILQHSTYLCLLSLIRAQLAGSRDRPSSCSHMPAVMTSPSSSNTAVALFCHFVSFFSLRLFLPLCFQWHFHNFPSHREKTGYYSGCVLQALPHGSLLKTERMHVGGCVSSHRRQWQEGERGDREMWRKGKNWFGWVSTSSRNYHRQRPCGQRVEPVEQNCSQVVWEMNL